MWPRQSTGRGGAGMGTALWHRWWTATMTLSCLVSGPRGASTPIRYLAPGLSSRPGHSPSALGGEGGKVCKAPSQAQRPWVPEGSCLPKPDVGRPPRRSPVLSATCSQSSISHLRAPATRCAQPRGTVGPWGPADSWGEGRGPTEGGSQPAPAALADPQTLPKLVREWGQARVKRCFARHTEGGIVSLRLAPARSGRDSWWEP